MTGAHVPHTTHATHTTQRHGVLPHTAFLLGLGAVILLALPAASALYVEGEAPRHSGAYVQADIAPAHDPLHHPLNLTLDELANLSSRAADATQHPGQLLNMTQDEEQAFHDLMARLDAGGHDGVRINETGYRFAMALEETFATGTIDGNDGSAAPPAHEPSDHHEAAGETGESSGIAIGTLTLLSAGAMYWVRRLA